MNLNDRQSCDHLWKQKFGTLLAPCRHLAVELTANSTVHGNIIVLNLPGNYSLAEGGFTRYWMVGCISFFIGSQRVLWKLFPHVCTFLPFLPAFQNEPFEWDSFQLHLPFLASPRQDCSLKNKIQWDSTINFQRGVLLGWRIYSIWNHTYISHGQTGLELEPIWSSSYLFLCN